MTEDATKLTLSHTLLLLLSMNFREAGPRDFGFACKLSLIDPLSVFHFISFFQFMINSILMTRHYPDLSSASD